MTQDGGTVLFYALSPDGPHPQFSEILGIYYSHNDLGDAAGRITADHRFRDHLHNLVPEDHTYYDVLIDGTCTYTNGVVTYFPDRSNAPQQDKFLRDVIVKVDAQGLWVIDPFPDALLCEVATNTIDLPPVPEGYRLVGH